MEEEMLPLKDPVPGLGQLQAFGRIQGELVTDNLVFKGEKGLMIEYTKRQNALPIIALTHQYRKIKRF